MVILAYVAGSFLFFFDSFPQHILRLLEIPFYYSIVAMRFFVSKFTKEELSLRTQLITSLIEAHPQCDEIYIAHKADPLWDWIKEDKDPIVNYETGS